MPHSSGDERIDTYMGFDLYGNYVPRSPDGERYALYWIIALKDEGEVRTGFTQRAKAAEVYTPDMGNEEKKASLKRRALEITQRRIDESEFENHGEYDWPFHG